MAISDAGRGLVRCLGVTAAAVFALAASQQRAEALSLASPGAVPAAKYATDGLTTEVRHGGGGHGGGGFRGGGGGGFRGGGFHGGGFAGGFHNGGYGRGFHGRFGNRFAFGSGLGYGFYPYDYYDDYSDYTYDPYAYYDDGGGCYVVQRRVHTSHGWRHQPVQVCG